MLLDALLTRSPTVVTLLRRGWCPYCSLQLYVYAAVLPELVALRSLPPARSSQEIMPS